ncbi:MAG: alkaline phosphatase family protein [bacterium]|nr:alkaline phosphatase family protein [bacterium]
MKNKIVNQLSFAAGLYGAFVGLLLVILNAHTLQTISTVIAVPVYLALLCLVPTWLVLAGTKLVITRLIPKLRKPPRSAPLQNEPEISPSPAGENSESGRNNVPEVSRSTGITMAVNGIILGYSAFLYWFNIREFNTGVPEATLSALNYSGWVLFGFGLIGIILGLFNLINPTKFSPFRIRFRRMFPITISGIIPLLLIFIAPILLIQYYQHQKRAGSAPINRGIPAEKSNKPARVIVIGWDGADWNVLDPLLRSGKMPNLQKLLKTSARGELQTFRPTISSAVWTSIYSGKTPRKHGITGFIGFRQNLFLPEPLAVAPVHMVETVSEFIVLEPFNKLLKISQRLHIWQLYLNTRFNKRAEMVWDILSRNGYTVGVVNAMLTIPAEPVNGFLVGDYLRHGFSVSPETVYPKTLVPEIKQLELLAEQVTPTELARFFPNQTVPAELARVINGNAPRNKRLAVYAENLKKIYAEDISTAKIAKTFIAKYQPQVVFIYFHGADVVSHHFWKYYEPEKFWFVSDTETQKYQQVIPRYYEFMDELLADFIPPENEDALLIICSDHGFETISAIMERYFSITGLIQSGNHYHAPSGIIVMNDNQANPQNLGSKAGILDITPTILWRLGLPIAEDMDGKPITAGYPAEYITRNPVKTITTYERPKTAAAAIGIDLLTPEAQERLESLGYINR